MNHKEVLVATKITPFFEKWLEQKGYKITYFEGLNAHDFSLFKGVITSNKLLMPKEVLQHFTYLEWIGRMGSGMEIIDLNYAARHNITIVSSPDGNANAVAEQALGTLLSLFHNIQSSSIQVQNGQWHREANRGYEIEGRKVGIVGLGNNGAAFAKKCIAMGMEVMYYDPYLKSHDIKKAQQCVTFEALLNAGIDVLSFHVPLNDSTWHYFIKEHLRYLNQPIYLLNLSRGAIVDWEAIYEGWKSGYIIKSGLDVLEKEPIEQVSSEQRVQMKEMMDQGDLILTPHIAGYTFEAIEKMGRSIIRQLEERGI